MQRTLSNLSITALRSRRALSSKVSSTSSLFYEVSGSGHLNSGIDIIGEKATANVLDLKNARPGDVIEVPYELTITQSFRDFWQSAFYSHDRINTSTPFCRALGLQEQVVPFSMLLFLTGAMSHAYDSAKIEVNYTNARYHWPGNITVPSLLSISFPFVYSLLLHSHSFIYVI